MPGLTKGIIDKLFGDRGYISQALFEQLWQQGLQLVTKIKKNIKNRLMPLLDKILLRKRAIIEPVNDQLKNIAQIVRKACRRQTFSSSQSSELHGQSDCCPSIFSLKVYLPCLKLSFDLSNSH